MWWTWTAPGSGQATVDTTGSSYDTLLAVYTGTAVSALTQIAANDDISSSVRTSKVTFAATAGKTYRIAVDGDRGTSSGVLSTGSIKLNWAVAATAPAADTTPPTASLTSPAEGATVGGSMTISANASDNVAVAKVGFLVDGAVVGTTTAPPYSTSWNSASVANGSATITARATDTAGNVATSAARAVTVQNATPPPPPSSSGPANDMFAAAQVASGGSGSTTGSNAGATKQTVEPNHAGNAGGASVWWTWTAPASGQATIDTAGSSFDTLLAVYMGGSVSALTQVAANDDVSSTVKTSSVTFSAVSGTTYRVAVDGYRGTSSVVLSTGSVKLNWSSVSAPPPAPAPANDLFASAQTLPASSGSVTGSNGGVTKETGEPAHAANAGGASVWYTWTAPASGATTIDTAGSSYDTLLAVYTGSSVSTLTQVAANDDVSSTVKTSSVTFSAVSGTSYRVAVDGYRGTSAAFSPPARSSSTGRPPPRLRRPTPRRRRFL